MNIPDNSKFESMVRNRPSSSLIPSVNKRLVAQYLGRTTFATVSFGLLGIIFLYKFSLNANSAPFLKDRKDFTF